MNKPSRYDHQKQDWNLNDADYIIDCDKEVVTCPFGKPGHYVYGLNVSERMIQSDGTYYQLIIKINHAHFTRNRDTGRHVEDFVRKDWIHEKYTVVSRRLDHAKLPEWLKGENLE